MSIKPLLASGLKPSRVKGFLHPLVRLTFGCIFPLLSLALQLLSSSALLLLCFPSAVHAQPGWGPDVRLCYLPGTTVGQRVAAAGDTVHVVWHQGWSDSTGSYDGVWYKRSTDEGVTWSRDTLLYVRDSLESFQPDITANGQYVYVVWNQQHGAPQYNYRVYFRRSTDGGTTWGSIDSLMAGWGVHTPRVKACGDTVYVSASLQVTQGPAGFRRSTDHGVTWGPTVDLGWGDYPALGVRGSMVYVTWQKYWSGGNPPASIFVQRSTDGGLSFEPGVVVSDTLPPMLGSQWPAICVDYQGEPHVTWFDYKYSPYAWTGDIFYRSSLDSAGSWLPFDSLCSEHRAVASDIVSQGDTLHVAWEDERVNPDSSNFEIFYRMSTDLGRSWGTEWRLTYARNPSVGPALAVGRQYLHLVWGDARDDTIGTWGTRLYYKRKDLRPSSVEQEENRKTGSSPLVFRVFPNPSRGPVWIENPFGEVDIYDITGRLVIKLNAHPKGLHQGGERVFWDGKENQGKEVRSGVYFIHAESASMGSETRKVTVLKGNR